MHCNFWKELSYDMLPNGAWEEYKIQYNISRTQLPADVKLNLIRIRLEYNIVVAD